MVGSLARARTDRRPARSRRRASALEQLAIEFAPTVSRWRFSLPAQRSPYRDRIRERLEFVRGFFPELDGITVRVGLVRKRGVLGWGSLDPDQPGIWVRPRRLDTFTIAHELTHLLQARGLVPGGERACDLWALARSPLLVDTPPGYLAVPARLRRRQPLPVAHAALLHRTAVDALAARERGERNYLRRFEREVDLAVHGLPAAEPEARRRPGLGPGLGMTLLGVFGFVRTPRA